MEKKSRALSLAETVLVCLALVFFAFCILPARLSLLFWDHLSAQSGVLATWFTAVATIILAHSVWQTKRNLQIAAQSSVFQLMQERFNAPNMLYARAVLARTHVDRKVNNPIKDSFLPSAGWLVLSFLNQVGHLVESGRLRFEDVELAYGDYLKAIMHRWKGRIDDESHKTRYASLLILYELMESSKSGLRNMIENPLDAYYDDAYWQCEAYLVEAAEPEA